jgi:hypothetical protein
MSLQTRNWAYVITLTLLQFLQSNVNSVWQGSYRTWKSLNVLEFENKNSRPWMSLKFVFFEICLTFKNTHCVELNLHVHIWQSCLKLIEVAFWTIECHFLLISNGLKPFCSPWISWNMPLKNVLEFDSSWHVLYKPWFGSHLSHVTSKQDWIDLSPYNQNFDLGKSRQIFHHSLKEHDKISNIAKFRCEML